MPRSTRQTYWLYYGDMVITSVLADYNSTAKHILDKARQHIQDHPGIYAHSQFRPCELIAMLPHVTIRKSRIGDEMD